MTVRAVDDYKAIRARMEELRTPSERGYATGGVVLKPVPLHMKFTDDRCGICGGLVESWLAPECTGACMG